MGVSGEQIVNSNDLKGQLAIFGNQLLESSDQKGETTKSDGVSNLMEIQNDKLVSSKGKMASKI